MKYILVHYGKEGYRIYVDGFIAPSGEDKDILKQIEKSLLEKIKEGISTSKDKQLLFSIQNPESINKKGNKLVEIKEINEPVKAGYWLEEIKTGKNIVNL